METKDFNALHGDEIDEMHGFIGNRYFREL
jgi:hypothetical protein